MLILFILSTFLFAEGKMRGFQKHIDFILNNAEELGLTPGQKKVLQEIKEEYSKIIQEKAKERDDVRKELYSVISPIMPNVDKALVLADRFGELSKEVLKLRIEAIKRTYETLQEEQKEKLKELKKKRTKPKLEHKTE
ncbi:MAG: Spy/CpxP family protein refolding chaperone [bacterium]|nr:Spy/CpxP family protein refolding chaperone [bacterium]